MRNFFFFISRLFDTYRSGISPGDLLREPLRTPARNHRRCQSFFCSLIPSLTYTLFQSSSSCKLPGLVVVIVVERMMVYNGLRADSGSARIAAGRNLPINSSTVNIVVFNERTPVMFIMGIVRVVILT